MSYSDASGTTFLLFKDLTGYSALTSEIGHGHLRWTFNGENLLRIGCVVKWYCRQAFTFLLIILQWHCENVHWCARLYEFLSNWHFHRVIASHTEKGEREREGERKKEREREREKSTSPIGYGYSSTCRLVLHSFQRCLIKLLTKFTSRWILMPEITIQCPPEWLAPLQKMTEKAYKSIRFLSY